MAPSAPTLSLQGFLQDERRKKNSRAKDEKLANAILGGSGKATSSKKNNNLASRVGVHKDSHSSHSSHTGNTRQNNTRSRDTSERKQFDNARRNNKHANRASLVAAETNLLQTTRPTPKNDFQILGAAGPYVVVAQNFAPGTTAADIQSVMEKFGGAVQSCILVATQPTCTAEIAFIDKSGADAVIAKFDKQKADGRYLVLNMKGSRTVQQDIAPQPVQTQQDVEMDVEYDERATVPERDVRTRNQYPSGPQSGRNGYRDDRYGYNDNARGRFQQREERDGRLRNDNANYNNRNDYARNGRY